MQGSRMTLSWYAVIIFAVRIKHNSRHQLESKKNFSGLQPENAGVIKNALVNELSEG